MLHAIAPRNIEQRAYCVARNRDMKQETLQRLTRWLLWFTVAVFVLYLVIYVVYAVALFQFPYDYDQGEGFELNDSLLFLQGQWPYRSNEVFPFYASNYPPLFHWLVMPLFAIFGPTLTGRARFVVCRHAADCGARRAGWSTPKRATDPSRRFPA